MKLFFLFLTICFTGCYVFPDPKSSPHFYQDYADWDIQYIPVVDPIRVSSIDKGITWWLTLDEFSGSEIQSFGVSENFVFGQMADGKWFLIDLYTKLWVKYGSKEQLSHTLTYFRIPYKDLNSCKTYYADLMKGNLCYWFPPTGEKYRLNAARYLKHIDTVYIEADKLPKLEVNASVNTNRTGIYYYRVLIQKGAPDSLYIEVDNGIDEDRYYRLIEDRMILPVNAPLSKYKLTLYTPLKTGIRRGLRENIVDTVWIHRRDSY